MTISSVVQLSPQMPRQFQDLVRDCIEYEALWNPASCPSNGEVHEEMTIPGAALGDMVLVSIDVDVQDLDVVAHVTAANTVTVGLHNPSAGAVDLAECNVHVVVLQLRHRH